MTHGANATSSSSPQTSFIESSTKQEINTVAVASEACPKFCSRTLKRRPSSSEPYLLWLSSQIAAAVSEKRMDKHEQQRHNRQPKAQSP